MAMRPTSSAWADDFSDEVDEDDTKRLLGHRVKTYQSTPNELLQEHEQGLDKLGEAIKRQRYMAEELATEVDVHNEIIDDIDTGLTNVNENLRKNTRNINLVTRKSSTFFLWLLVVVLAAIIVVLAIL